MTRIQRTGRNRLTARCAQLTVVISGSLIICALFGCRTTNPRFSPATAALGFKLVHIDKPQQLDLTNADTLFEITSVRPSDLTQFMVIADGRSQTVAQLLQSAPLQGRLTPSTRLYIGPVGSIGFLSPTKPAVSAFQCNPQTCSCNGQPDCKDLFENTNLCKGWSTCTWTPSGPWWPEEFKCSCGREIGSTPPIS